MLETWLAWHGDGRRRQTLAAVAEGLLRCSYRSSYGPTALGIGMRAALGDEDENHDDGWEEEKNHYIEL